MELWRIAWCDCKFIRKLEKNLLQNSGERMKAYIVLFTIGFHCNLMKAHFNSVESFYALKSKYDPADPTECTTILNDFAEYASNFTKCSIQHARPIRLCAECIDQYVKFHDKYQELATTIVNGTTCKSLFISHDRLDAVLVFHDSISAIWEKGNCNGCFDWDQGKPEMSNTTKLFNTMFNETNDCITKNLNPNNTTEVCETCMETYVKLDEFYKSMSEDAIGVDSICIDIVDSMNATRYKWSKVLDCCSLRRSPEIIFLCCTAILAMLPILFYVAVRYCGPIRDLPNVLKQSRFKQIILRSSDGRIN